MALMEAFALRQWQCLLSTGVLLTWWGNYGRNRSSRGLSDHSVISYMTSSCNAICLSEQPLRNRVTANLGTIGVSAIPHMDSAESAWGLGIVQDRRILTRDEMSDGLMLHVPASSRWSAASGDRCGHLTLGRARIVTSACRVAFIARILLPGSECLYWW